MVVGVVVQVVGNGMVGREVQGELEAWQENPGRVGRRRWQAQQ